MSITLPGRLSYSSLNSYSECGERWRLERGHNLNGSTWWATIAGSAIHEISEAIDYKLLGYDIAEPDFEMKLNEHEAKAKLKGQAIKASGKVTQKIGKTGGPDKKNRDWWLVWGPIYIQAYKDWRALSRWKILTLPDGKPAIEVRVPVKFAGRDQLGFIDRVFVKPTGEIVITDIKTGNMPASKLQLGTYAIALKRLCGIDADLGTFWMAQTGEVTNPMLDVTIYTEEYVDHLFEMAWNGIEAGVFLPNVTSMCSGCGVRDWCRAVGGRQAVSIPVKDVLKRRDGTSPERGHVDVARLTHV